MSINFAPTKTILSFFDHRTGNLLYQVDAAAVSAMRYGIELNAISKIALTVPYDAWLDDVIDVPDTLVEVSREQDGAYYKEKCYLLRAFDMFYDDETGVEQVVLGGMSLEHLLSRRHMRSSDDPIAAGGYITRAGEASEVLAQYAQYQIGSGASTERRIFELSITYDGTGASSGGRYQDEDTLFDVFDELSNRGNVDFEIMRQQSNKLLLKIGKIGEDKTVTSGATPVVFSRARGTLFKPRYNIDRSDETSVIVGILGGEVGNRTIFDTKNNEALADGDWNRVERPLVIKRERDESALEALNKSQLELSKNQAVREFSFAIDAESSGSQYRRDFIVGDTITAIWRGDLREDLRVTGVETTIDVIETMAIKVSRLTA